jgi:hypothetical protein
MSEFFGIEFDKHIYKSLLEDIDFRDQKTFLNNRNFSNKMQFLMQEFPALLSRSDFINIFTNILDYNTLNASAAEIFDGLHKICKLSYEFQFKILLSFFFCHNQRFKEDIKKIFLNKCTEFSKESSSDKLTKPTITQIILIIHSSEELRREELLMNFISFLVLPNNTKFTNNSKSSELKEQEEFIEDLNNIIVQTDNYQIDQEKIILDLGPWLLNTQITLNKTDLINSKLDEKRLASFIIYILKQPQCTEDKELRNLNKVFLQVLNNDLYMAIDDNTDKKQTLSWNLEHFYKSLKPAFENFDYALPVVW